MCSYKLYKLTYDDFKSLSVGDVVYYRYGVTLYQCYVYKVTSKRVIVLCHDWLDDSVYFRYILERNYGLYYKE